ncbi:hypothetical protein KJE20_11785 [Pyrenophora tritici-repentis]|nr:hypothetical protein KJE20_11785 [Pyrenophora tritici-repentis]
MWKFSDDLNKVERGEKKESSPISLPAAIFRKRSNGPVLS